MQFGGLLVAEFAFPIYALGPSLQSAGTPQATPGFFLIFIVYLFVVSFALIWLFKRVRGQILYRLFEAAVILIATSFLFFLVIGSVVSPADYTYAALLSAALAVALVIAKNKKQSLRNTAAVLASMGVGLALGISGFQFAYAFMAIIALYDYIAVFVTKHMLALAKGALNLNLAFLIGSSEVEIMPKGYFKEKKGEMIGRLKKEGIYKDKIIRDYAREGRFPVVSQIMLGSGDLAVPLMVAVGAYVGFASTFFGDFVVVGAFAGLIATMVLLKKYMIGLPAIPPLFAFVNIALGIAYLAKGMSIVTALEFFAMGILVMGVLLFTLSRIGREGRSI